MPKDVVLPLLGLTMEEGSIARWAKAEGDPVRKGDVLFEVETDKATQEVESQLNGFLAKILVDTGKVCPVGTIIAIISENEDELLAIQDGTFDIDEYIDTLKDTNAPAVKVDKSKADNDIKTGERTASTVAGTKQVDRVPVSPSARRVAADKGVNLSDISGSGPGGRIMKDDVLDFLASSTEADAASQEEYVALTTVRKLTAERMARSFQEVPHFYLSTEVDATGLVQFRTAYLDEKEGHDAPRLSYTDLLIKGIGVALKNHPLLYAVWDDGKIRLNGSINIALATNTDDGLTVPVIIDADKITLESIIVNRYGLVQRAQQSRLTLNDLSAASFTLTNLGMFDIDIPQAIINPPQAAILATGSIKNRVVEWEGEVHVRPSMYVTLSVDHRVVDGVAAAKFLQEFKGWVETLEYVRSE